MPVGDASPLFPTVAPYLDFDAQTNLVILHAEQNLTMMYILLLSNVNSVKIYFNEKLDDLFVGIPYEFKSETGELN